MGWRRKFNSLGDAQVGFWLGNPPSLLPHIISMNLLSLRSSLCTSLYFYLLSNIFEQFFSPKMSYNVTHDSIFFSPLKFNLIIRKLLFLPPLITLVWQTANFTDIRSLQHVLEIKRGKKLLRGKPCIMESIWHAVSNLFFSSWRQENPPINFILQKKKAAMSLIE